MTVAGKLLRQDFAKISQDQRVIKFLDQQQDLVFDSPFNQLGDPVASVAAANTSIPITINGVQYYLKLSTAP